MKPSMPQRPVSNAEHIVLSLEWQLATTRVCSALLSDVVDCETETENEASCYVFNSFDFSPRLKTDLGTPAWRYQCRCRNTQSCERLLILSFITMVFAELGFGCWKLGAGVQNTDEFRRFSSPLIRGVLLTRGLRVPTMRTGRHRFRRPFKSKPL